MIEFHSGSGPDSEAVGVALEEMFLDYRVVSGGASIVIVDSGAHIEGMKPILLHLALHSDRLLPEPQRKEIARWLDLAANGAVDPRKLEAQLAASPYILGDITLADMAVYPIVSRLPHHTLQAHTTRWVRRMSQRSATGRGIGAVMC